MDFTPAGRKVLARIQRRTSLSRNDVLAHLLLTHEVDVNLNGARVLFPGKAQSVLRIALPSQAFDALERLRALSGRSASDIGEALVRQFEKDQTFPVVLGRTRRRKRRQS